jgi:hypothetical protein
MQLLLSDEESISSAGIELRVLSELLLVGLLIAIYPNYRYRVDKSLHYLYYQPFSC